MNWQKCKGMARFVREGSGNVRFGRNEKALCRLACRGDDGRVRLWQGKDFLYGSCRVLTGN